MAHPQSVQTLDLERVRIDGQTQPRAEIDMFTVDDYATAMQSGAEFPPGEVVFDGASLWLWDGFHRYHGARKAGLKALRFVVRSGTVEDARWLALAANKTHGLRRTNDDKRRAVELALKARPELSNSAIAEHVGVDDMTVGKYRREMEATSEIRKSTTVTGKDGRTINTANIGKPKPQESTSTLFTPEMPPAHPAPAQVASPPVDRVPLATVTTQAVGEQGEDGETDANDSPLGRFITLQNWQAMSDSERNAALASNGTAKFNDQGKNESIEWALWSWNPVTGCRHDCPYCYARDIANRFYKQKFEPSLWPDRLTAPQNTRVPKKKIAEEKAKGTLEGNARALGYGNVFTCSMADLFGRWVPTEWIEAVLAAVRAAPQWNFLFLTKFPKRLSEFTFPDNAWVGTTVDCQARVKNAENAFRKVKAGVKWLSCEPLIEPLRFEDLGAFDWLVIGGSSKSSETPEWMPPRRWVQDIETEAFRLGVKVYEKTNLKPSGGWDRVRQYPGIDDDAVASLAPEQLRYLPSEIG